jgi:hypothetical protein
MKDYRAIRNRSGIVFVCDQCDFRVELAKFGTALIPSKRTLGAAEMNTHIAEAHPKSRGSLDAWGIK